ncbi:MAG: S9 family peptidase [Pseudoxanthomonas sp.]
MTEGTAVRVAMATMLLATLSVAVVATAAPSDRGASAASALFGARESIEQIDLSPDGNRVVYVTPGPGRTSVAVVVDLANNNTSKTVAHSSGAPDQLSWCRFASNERLVCQVTGVSEYQGSLVPFSRLFAVGIDGGKLTWLSQRSSRYDARLRQFDGSVLDWLPQEQGAILMAREYVPEAGKSDTRLVRTADGLGVDRVDIATLQITPVESPIKTADTFLTDGRGVVRIKGEASRAGTGLLTGVSQYRYRLENSKEWLPLSNWDGDHNGMLPIAVEADTNSVFVLKKLDSRLALYRVKLDSSLQSELVYQNASVDVDGVVTARRGADVIGVTFSEEKRHVIYFDPAYDRLARALAKAIPQLPMIDFTGASADGKKLLIHAGSDADPGRYYLYDTSARSLNELLLARPELEQTTLAHVTAITYTARDGTKIPAYLTMPPGKEQAQGLPALVLPHGGPSARDEWGFDWLAQFLANQGYAVLQPNYRGSAGFGDAWLVENGFKGWRTSIGDVADAGKWLVSQGIASPKKLSIVGWSYGGYAALQSGVLEPGLFKAMVAIAPVTDLDLIKRDAYQYTSRKTVANEIGSGAHIKEGSPLQNVDRFVAPVLLFHGDTDLNVSDQHSIKMHARLKGAGKSSELVSFKGLDHGLQDADARTQMLDRISTFLQQNTAE